MNNPFPLRAPRLRAAAHRVAGGAFVVGEELVVTGRLVAVVLDDLIDVEVVERAPAVVVVRRAGRDVVPGDPVVDGLITEPAVTVNRPSARAPGGPVRRTRYSPCGFVDVAR